MDYRGTEKWIDEQNEAKCYAKGTLLFPSLMYRSGQAWNLYSRESLRTGIHAQGKGQDPNRGLQPTYMSSYLLQIIGEALWFSRQNSASTSLHILCVCHVVK